jgi:hypothetical protein
VDADVVLGKLHQRLASARNRQTSDQG